MITNILFLAAALTFGIAWGAMENRVWREQGEYAILNHFKTYHAAMATLFGWVNALTATAIYGTAFTIQGSLLWLWLMIYDILILDVTWWLIRWNDFQINSEQATKTYGEPNAWHLQTDWDNWLKLPLICGVYWWWWVFTAILITLSVIATALPLP